MSGPGNGGEGGFSGGGAPFIDCTKVSIKTNVISPNPAVLGKLSVGADLNITLQTPSGPLLAITKANEILGTVFTTDPTLLIQCINNGYTYKATILDITGGDVQIIVLNK
jgi:hypothetical protein